jgi:hypothetical protein
LLSPVHGLAAGICNIDVQIKIRWSVGLTAQTRHVMICVPGIAVHGVAVSHIPNFKLMQAPAGSYGLPECKSFKPGCTISERARRPYVGAMLILAMSARQGNVRTTELGI